MEGVASYRLLAFAVFAEDPVVAFAVVPAFAGPLSSVLPMKRAEKCAIPMMTMPSD